MTLLAIFLMVLIIFGLWGTVFWIRRKRRAGAVLLDLGPSKLRIALGVIMGSLMIFLGVVLWWMVLCLRPPGLALFSVIPILTTCAAVEVFLMGLSRSEIREGGIFPFFLMVVEWERIESYEWGGRDGHILRIKGKRGGGKTSLRVPAAHKEEVENILAQHLSHDMEG